MLGTARQNLMGKKDLLRKLNGSAKFENGDSDYFVNSQNINVKSTKFSAAMDLSLY
jgi:hypothetical protein